MLVIGGWLKIELVVVTVKKKELIRSEAVKEVWKKKLVLELVV